MIGKTLQDVLNEKGVNVNELSNMINVSNQTLYSIIKRDNMKIDFEVLLKICDALDVSVERFYSDFYHSNKNKVLLTNHENKVITAYRNKPEMQPAVDKILEIEPEYETVLMAARSKDNKPIGYIEIPKDKLDLFDSVTPVTNEDDI